MIAALMSADKTISRNQLVSAFFIALLLFIVYHIVLILSPFFVPIFWAVVLAFGFYPLYNKIRNRLGGADAAAALLTTLLVFLLFVPLVAVVVFNIAEEAVRFYYRLSEFIREGHLQEWWDGIKSFPVIGQLESYLSKGRPEGWLSSQATALAEFTGRQTGALTKNIALFAMRSVLSFFLMFFFLKDGEKIYRFFYEITPLEEENKKEIFRRLNDTFTAVLRGQILTALAQALLSGVVFWLLGLPVPVFFAAVTFMTAMIPIFGAAAVWLPFVVFLLMTQAYTKALILFLIGTLGISLLDNFLKPMLIGEKTKLPYFLLFLGILGGLQIYGVMGIFLAPAALSIFFVLIKIYREKFPA